MKGHPKYFPMVSIIRTCKIMEAISLFPMLAEKIMEDLWELINWPEKAQKASIILGNLPKD